MFVKADGVKLLAPLVTPATNQQYIQVIILPLLLLLLMMHFYCR